MTTGADGTARVWAQSGRGQLLHELRGQGALTAGAVSPDGRLLVTTSADTTARVWALPSGNLISDLIGHNNRVNGVAFSKDGSAFVTWSADGTARVWDRGRGAARIVLAGHGDSVAGASFDASGDTVLTTSANGIARLWASRVDSQLRPVSEVRTPIVAASFSGSGNAVAVAGSRGIEVLDVDGQRIASLPMRSPAALAVSRDGSVVAGAVGRRTSIWRLPDTEPVGTVSAPRTPTALALDPPGARLAIGSSDGEVRVWTPGQESFTTLTGSEHPVTSIAFSADGESLAAGFANGALVGWRLSDGKMLYRKS